MKAGKAYFVDEDSIVRQIWGRKDVVLLIFAGASAEFAVHRSVDWLFFTGALPADPLGRLFSTATYARNIVFAKTEQTYAVIDRMNQIHAAIEQARGRKIPDWAYRDVLYMLIDYSIRADEALYRKLNADEKEEVYEVFQRVGHRMQIPGLPANYTAWAADRVLTLNTNYVWSKYSHKLHHAYQHHLGIGRYALLEEAQYMLLPDRLLEMLDATRPEVLPVLTRLLKFFRWMRANDMLIRLLVPNQYLGQLKEMEQPRGCPFHRLKSAFV